MDIVVWMLLAYYLKRLIRKKYVHLKVEIELK